MQIFCTIQNICMKYKKVIIAHVLVAVDVGRLLELFLPYSQSIILEWRGLIAKDR